jgi:hypothetical protein
VREIAISPADSGEREAMNFSQEDLIEFAARGAERAAGRSAATDTKILTLDVLVPLDGAEVTLREWIRTTNSRLWSVERAANEALFGRRSNAS